MPLSSPLQTNPGSSSIELLLRNAVRRVERRPAGPQFGRALGQRFWQDAGVSHRSHEARVPYPSRQHVHVEVPRHSGTSRLAQICPQVDAVGFVRRL